MIEVVHEQINNLKYSTEEVIPRSSHNDRCYHSKVPIITQGGGLAISQNNKNATSELVNQPIKMH